MRGGPGAYMSFEDDGDQRRLHGFQRPFHPLQVVSWVVFGSDVVVFVVFCMPIVDTVAAQVCLSICFAVSVVVLVYATAKATACDPADAHVDTDESEFKDEDARSMPFCRMCNVSVYSRSKHCRACNKCVHVFDHHCTWLNNCIGAANYHWFFMTVSAVAVMIGIVLFTSLYIFVDYFVNEGFDERVQAVAIFQDVPMEFFLGLLIFMLCINSPLFLLDLQLVLLHLFLASQDLTTYEYIMSKRDENGLDRLKRHVRQLPTCLDWIVFSRCGQRRRAKKHNVQHIGAKADGGREAPGDNRQGPSAAAELAEAGAASSSDEKLGPKRHVKVDETAPSPPGSTVDEEDREADLSRSPEPPTTCSDAPTSDTSGSGEARRAGSVDPALVAARPRPDHGRGSTPQSELRFVQESEQEGGGPTAVVEEDPSIGAGCRLACGCDAAPAPPRQNSASERASG